MSEIDHRAKALSFLALATEMPSGDARNSALAAAQVHATLAAGEGDLAERYRRAYAETLAERDELRAAALLLLDHLTAGYEAGDDEAGDAAARVRELVGGA